MVTCFNLFKIYLDILSDLCITFTIFYYNTIYFSIDSSEVIKQYDEYCLSIMQTITYAHDRTHFNALHTQTFDPPFVHWRLI